MNAQRTFEVIFTELVLDNLKLQEKLEAAINSNEKIDEKVITVKDLLERIVLNESMTVKFKSLLPNNNSALNASETPENK